MAYAQIAAVALPYILGAMQDKPDAPRGPAPVMATDRSDYIDQILRAGFDPQTDLYNQASSQVADTLERQMARRGIAGGTIGGGVTRNALTDLANKYMENELARKQKALAMTIDYDFRRSDQANQANTAAYNYANQSYQDQMARQAGATAGISGMATAGLGIYQQQQMQNQRQENFDRVMSMNQGAPAQAQLAPMMIQPAPQPAPNQYGLGLDYNYGG